MQNSSADIILLTIGITTFVLLVVGAVAVRYVFLYQDKRYRHQQEVTDIREAFSNTLLQSKLEIKEQTLDHVAKELHATVGHSVSLIQIELEELAMEIPGGLKSNVSRMQDFIQHLFNELKAVNGSLNTDHIMHIGLSKALENELLRLKRRYHVQFTGHTTGFELPPENAIILFRLCQEVLNNIVKHAQARSIRVALDDTAGAFVLEITDDGRGFDVSEALQQSGAKVSTGLINIRKRAKLINADITINSIPGTGTQFFIQIPHTAKPFIP